MPRKLKEYALYKGEELVDMGTAPALAKRRGVSVDTIYWYHSPTHINRNAKGKNPNNRIVAVPLDFEEDDDEELLRVS